MINKIFVSGTISRADVIEAMHEYARRHNGFLDDATYEFVEILTGLDEKMIWNLLMVTQEKREVTV